MKRPALLYLWPALVACIAAGAIFVALTSLASRSPSTQRRFSAWAERGKLEPGELLVWSGMLYATNAEHPEPPPHEFADLAPRMKKLFGYNQFKIVDETELVADSAGTRWFVPQQNLYFAVRIVDQSNLEKIGVNLQLWREKEMLVDADATVSPGSPLFIRGPLKCKGQLIFALIVASPPGEASAGALQ